MMRQVPTGALPLIYAPDGEEPDSYAGWKGQQLLNRTSLGPKCATGELQVSDLSDTSAC